MGDKKEISKRTKIILICAVLIFTFIWVYRPHFDYKYPLHVDEWSGINEAKRIQEEGKTYDKHEIGFFVFLAGLDTMFNLVLIYKFLPALVACISSLALFFLVSRKTNFLTGIFATFFFASLPSNLNILGIQYLTALTLSFPFLFIFALFFTEGFEELNMKKLVIAIASLTLLAFIHPSIAMLIFAVSVIYLFVNYNKTKKITSSIIKRYPWILIFPALIILWMFYFLWKGSILPTLVTAFSQLKFEIGYTHYQVNYFLPALYGWIASLFAIIGISQGLKKKNFLFFNCWLCVSFVSLLIFILFKVSILASYQRVIYFSFLSLIPFSALGTNYFVKKSKKYAKPIVMVILIILALFYFHYEPGKDLKPFNLIDEKEYETLEFLSTLNKSMLMTPVQESLAVYYLTSHDTIQCKTYYTCLESASVVDAIVFYNEEISCEERKKILEKYQIRYIWSQKPIDCGFKKIFENGNYVYEFEKFSKVNSPAECKYYNELIDCKTNDGKPGVQQCSFFHGWNKILKKCLLNECYFDGQIVNCTTKEGKPGIQRCKIYEGYGKMLDPCLPYECEQSRQIINCTTHDNQQGYNMCWDYKGYGKVWSGCWSQECYDEKEKRFFNSTECLKYYKPR